MKNIVTVILFLYSLIVTGQEASSYNFLSDNYLLEFKIGEKILTDKCDCCANVSFSKSSKKRMCTLYKVEILKVIKNLKQESSYVDSELINIKYVIIEDTPNAIITSNSNSLFGYFYESCTKEMLVFNRIVQTDSLQYEINREPGAHIVGLANCKKIKWHQKLRLFLGINKEKIWKQIKLNEDRESVFANQIK